ncbi:MAG: UDP-N-acetylmuramate--L-alanine ligase [Syntrophomonadaceae bacterium]|nr:UDP-N-acetylmuramate--L-alanine ligase [Bacillota bacterium]
MFEKNIHFVGIGGAGMSGIAQLLFEKGHAVSGSDLKKSNITSRLRQRGIQIYIGHHRENIEKAELVIFSSAVLSDNPELVAAREKKLRIIKRGEALAELMQEKLGIAIAGSHGKTITSSMIAFMLVAAGKDPTVIIGGESNDLGGNARLGRSKYLVAEADESDGSFLMLSPEIAVITNVEADHLDYYGDLKEVITTFEKFSRNVPADGTIICSSSVVKKVLMGDRKIASDLLVYGVDNDEADLTAQEIVLSEVGSQYHAFYHGKTLGDIRLHIPGMHNVYNSLAAVAVGIRMGISFGALALALACFSGVRRRFELKGEVEGVMLIDDYAHHPTEIKAVLSTAQKLRRRIIAVFQPHRFTRTNSLKESFADSFTEADFLVVTEVYSAGEKEIKGVTGRTIFDLIKQKEKIFISNRLEIGNYLMKIIKPGDLLITIGAGDITELSEEMMRRLKENVVDKLRA